MKNVIVIGGGITGAGIARDLTLRGMSVTLIEKHSPAASATGRCHGLLHSGARYAVKDAGSARECAEENLVLKDIASECIEDTGGLFLAITEDDAAYGDVLIPSCKISGIPVEEISPSDSPNSAAIRCIRTNDARIDPFLLTLANMYDAYKNGAEIIIGKSVINIDESSVILDDGSRITGEIVVNATGHECERLLRSSGRKTLPVQPNKGTLLVTERRVSDIILNRMRPPTNGDIIVPCHTTSLIGTTSSNSISTVPTRDEFKELIREASMLLPSVKYARVIRAFSGIRPLLGSGDGRSLSRDYQILEDGGSITVAGGKLTTYRLVAEKVSDLAMRLLGASGKCSTKTPLPDVFKKDPPTKIICNCESAVDRLIPMDFLNGVDISKYNRVGFGACQGMRCLHNSPAGISFLQERWKGVKPVISEGQFQQAYLSWASYMSRLGRI
ncbi:glycerol-3-phosphate dehydrogenase [Methanocella sp. CWC-04]|uniref:Glycerol-3-phosphate dehydrogenase n=1 Tax=Methanooceanicella nereidis TaxID=2052831 RepID=A0AAP2RDG9_9EURY|nr:FAD-dependent oxidoreductase [Methanocella sp. CWC-04]MCD1295503.1 glycerol-3-phosphate dehydrogenase [Methanocella sp. CWC-04]